MQTNEEESRNDSGESDESSNSFASVWEYGGKGWGGNYVTSGWGYGGKGWGGVYLASGWGYGGKGLGSDNVVSGRGYGGKGWGSDYVASGRGYGGKGCGSDYVASGRGYGGKGWGSDYVASGRGYGGKGRGSDYVASGRGYGGKGRGSDYVASGRGYGGKGSGGDDFANVGKYGGNGWGRDERNRYRSRGRGPSPARQKNEEEKENALSDSDDSSESSASISTCGRKLSRTEIFDVILKEHDGIISFKKFREIFPQFTNIKWQVKFLFQEKKSYTLFQRGRKILHIGVYDKDVSYCIPHADENTCNKRRCRSFHICKYFLSGFCRFGTKCRLSHSFSDAHNSRIKTKLGLDNYSDEDLATLLRNCYPQICFESLETCSEGDNCPYMHICHFFVRGDCTRSNCHFSHDFDDEHNSWVIGAFPDDRVDKDDEDLADSIPYPRPRTGVNPRYQFTDPLQCNLYMLCIVSCTATYLFYL